MESIPESQKQKITNLNSIHNQGFDIPIYLPSGKSGSVKIPKLTEDEWNLFISILNVYKPSVIREAKPERETEKSEDTQQ